MHVGDAPGDPIAAGAVRRSDVREPSRVRRAAGHRHGEPELRSPPGRAVEPQRAAHQLDQPLGDGQTQARAPELAGGVAVGLGEGLEDRRDKCMEFFAEVMSGNAVLVTDSGIIQAAMTFDSTTIDYKPVFDMRKPSAWRIDPDRIDDEEDEDE